MDTDTDTRAQVLKLLDDAKAFEDLERGLLAMRGLGVISSVVLAALEFVLKGDPTGLDEEVEERFAQVLSRMVESKQALALAAVLEGRR